MTFNSQIHLPPHSRCLIKLTSQSSPSIHSLPDVPVDDLVSSGSLPQNSAINFAKTSNNT